MNATQTCHINSSETFGGNGWIGVVLSMVGDIIINIGMNAMKHAHNINQDPVTKEPIKHFIYVPWWWCGIVGVVGGELANLVAYGYAPASVVTPIGSIGVVTNVFITTLVLKEKFTKVNMAGVISVVAGIVLVVYYAPRAVIEIKSAGIWSDVVYTMQGAVYFAVFVGGLAIMYPLSRKYGEKYVCVYIMMCAIIASLTIVCAKTFSSIFKRATDNGFETEFNSPVPYITIVVMVITAVVSTGYVNKAMMTFGNAQVVPTYFALFTTCSVASVAWVYREFDCLLDLKKSLLFMLGIVLAVSGVCLVQRSHVDPRSKETGSFMIRPKSSHTHTDKVHPDPEEHDAMPKPNPDGPTWTRETAGAKEPKEAAATVDIETGLADYARNGQTETPFLWEAPVHASGKTSQLAVGEVNGNGHSNGNGNGHGKESADLEAGNGEGTTRESARSGEVTTEELCTPPNSIELARAMTAGSLPGEVAETEGETSFGRSSSAGAPEKESKEKKRRSRSSGGPKRLRQLKPMPPQMRDPESPSKRDNAPLLPDKDASLPLGD